MRSHRSTKLLAAMAVGLVAALLLAPATARGQIGDQPTVRSIALGPGPEPGTEVLAMISINNSTSYVISLGALNGGSEVADPGSTLSSSILTPGSYVSVTFISQSKFALLDSTFHLLIFDLVSAPAKSLRVTGPTTQGPFGDPRVDGNPKALARVLQPTDPWIAIGTDTGRLIFIRGGRRVEHLDLAGPIVDLTVVPQVGYFAFVALVNGRDGQQHLVGLRPPELTADSLSTAQVVFDGVWTIYGSQQNLYVAQTSWEWWFSEPTPVQLIAANSTRFIHRLTIPANPTIGGTFRVHSLEAADVPIAQTAVGSGSLALLPVDGAGVLYDPGFRVDRGGVSGKLLTVFGSSLELRPRRLSLQGRRRFVTTAIEVASNNAREINPSTIELHVGEGGVPIAPDSDVELGDTDRDGNADLKVKFDRAAVQALIPAGASSLLVTVRWLFTDGSRGSASAELRVKSQGDDDDEGNN